MLLWVLNSLGQLDETEAIQLVESHNMMLKLGRICICSSCASPAYLLKRSWQLKILNRLLSAQSRNPT